MPALTGVFTTVLALITQVLAWFVDPDNVLILFGIGTAILFGIIFRVARMIRGN